MFVAKKKNWDNAKRIRKLTKEEIKQQRIDSLINRNKIETEKLNEKADAVEKSDDATTIIKDNKEKIRTKMKNTLCITYHQGKVLRRFKEKVSFSQTSQEVQCT